MKHIVFKYKDRFTNGKWNTQTCTMHSVSECIRVYGLGVDCEYEIVSVKDLDEQEQ